MNLLTVAQVATLRGVRPVTVRGWIRRGLPARKIGVQWLIRESDARRFKPRPAGNPNMGPRFWANAKETA